MCCQCICFIDSPWMHQAIFSSKHSFNGWSDEVRVSRCDRYHVLPIGSVQQCPELNWLFVTIWGVIYFQFQFPHFVCFIAWMNMNWTNFCFITCIKELLNIELTWMSYVPKHSEQCWFRICIICAGRMVRGPKFTSDKHKDIQLYVLVQILKSILYTKLHKIIIQIKIQVTTKI